MKDNILIALVMISTFFLLFFIMKLTLFQGLGNTYATDTHNQISFSVLLSPDIVLYLLYSFFVLFTGTVLSFYVAPVFFTLIGYTSMNDENKKIYLFSVLSAFVIIGAIAYTISIREDFLIEPMPRLHMRFITPLLIPILIQCLDILFSTESSKLKKAAKLPPVSKRDKNIAIIYPYIIALFYIIVLLIFTSTEKSVYGMDGATLRSLFALVTIVLYAGTTPVNVLFLLHNLILLVLTSYGSFTIIMKKNKTAVIIFLVASLLVINAYDNFISYTDIRISKTRDFTQAYFIGLSDSHFELAFNTDGLTFSYEIVESLISVNNQINDIDDNIIVFVPGDFASYTDTYLNPKAFPVTPFEFYEIATENGGRVRIEEQPLTEGNRFLNRILELDSWKRGIFSVEYIITITDGHPFLNVEVEYENWPFILLRNLNPDVVSVAME